MRLFGGNFRDFIASKIFKQPNEYIFVIESNTSGIFKIKKDHRIEVSRYESKSINPSYYKFYRNKKDKLEILDKNLLLDKIYQVNNVTVVGDDIIAQILLSNGNDLKVIFDQNSKNLKGWETTSMDQKKVVFRINEVKRNLIINETFDIPDYN